LVSSIVFFYVTWNTRARPWRAAPAGLKVDVYVPTYNEPTWVVRRTLLGALAMRYRHRTYLLDDGRRPQMKALARELGVVYLTRAGNAGAKAGNINAALRRTKGDLIVIFDADHVPLPAFLQRTLGYFADPRVAFVQTPQEFYNVDSFQHQTDFQRKRMWHEQALFYRVLQPGKDHWGAAFFCGSCGVLRRQAIADVGGMATETVTEDMHTSIRMHARGWTSAYHNEVLALGLAPQTAAPFHSQRLRWGQGAMQIFRRDNPLTTPGLTLHQRINYLASMLHWFDGFQRLAFYVAPSLYLATGVLPIRALDWDFIMRAVPYYILAFLAFKFSSRGYGLFMLTERMYMIRFYTYIKTTSALVSRRHRKFTVTKKDRLGKAPLATLLPSFLTGLMVLAGLLVGVARVILGHERNLLAFGVNAVWSFWNLALSTSAIRLTMRKIDFRKLPRARAGLPMKWTSSAGSGVGVLVDINERGAAVLVRDWTAASTLKFSVAWPKLRLSREGVIRRVRATAHGYLVGLEWDEEGQGGPSEIAAMALSERKFLLDLDRPWDRFGLMEFRRGHRRRRRRHAVGVPVQIKRYPATWGVTEDVSDGGAMILFPRPLKLGARVRVSLWGGQGVLAEVVRCSALELPPDNSHRIGLRWLGVAVSSAKDPVAPRLAA
jgi:cellulose synthase (UDP-forming)